MKKKTMMIHITYRKYVLLKIKKVHEEIRKEAVGLIYF